MVIAALKATASSSSSIGSDTSIATGAESVWWWKKVGEWRMLRDLGYIILKEGGKEGMRE